MRVGRLTHTKLEVNISDILFFVKVWPVVEHFNLPIKVGYRQDNLKSTLVAHCSFQLHDIKMVALAFGRNFIIPQQWGYETTTQNEAQHGEYIQFNCGRLELFINSDTPLTVQV